MQRGLYCGRNYVFEFNENSFRYVVSCTSVLDEIFFAV